MPRPGNKCLPRSRGHFYLELEEVQEWNHYVFREKYKGYERDRERKNSVTVPDLIMFLPNVANQLKIAPVIILHQTPA